MRKKCCNCAISGTIHPARSFDSLGCGRRWTAFRPISHVTLRLFTVQLVELRQALELFLSGIDVAGVHPVTPLYRRTILLQAKMPTPGKDALCEHLVGIEIFKKPSFVHAKPHYPMPHLNSRLMRLQECHVGKQSAGKPWEMRFSTSSSSIQGVDRQRPPKSPSVQTQNDHTGRLVPRQHRRPCHSANMHRLPAAIQN